jgi:serine/threonine protein phosphatase PrpC
LRGDSPGSPTEGVPDGRTCLPIGTAIATDIGLIREENEDNSAVASIERGPSAGGVLAIVADGMGGLSGGATASKIVVEAIVEAVRTGDADPPGSLEAAVRRANLLIYSRTAEAPGRDPMGTTVTAMIVRDERAWIAHVGDSRAYRLRPSEPIARLTRDHTWVEELSRRGEIEPGSFQYSLHRSILTRGVGLRPEVDVDVIQIGDVGPGDIFLLCSDGLHEMIGDPEIEAQARARGADIEGLANGLIRIALDRGAPDNITVVIVRVGDRPLPAVRSADAGAAEPGSGRDRAGSGESGSAEGGTSRLFPRGGFMPLSLFLAFALGVLAVIVLEIPQEEKIVPPALELPAELLRNDAGPEISPPEEAKKDQKATAKDLEKDG